MNYSMSLQPIADNWEIFHGAIGKKLMKTLFISFVHLIKTRLNWLPDLIGLMILLRFAKNRSMQATLVTSRIHIHGSDKSHGLQNGKRILDLRLRNFQSLHLKLDLD